MCDAALWRGEGRKLHTRTANVGQWSGVTGGERWDNVWWDTVDWVIGRCGLWGGEWEMDRYCEWIFTYSLIFVYLLTQYLHFHVPPSLNLNALACFMLDLLGRPLLCRLWFGDYSLSFATAARRLGGWVPRVGGASWNIDVTVCGATVSIQCPLNWWLVGPAGARLQWLQCLHTSRSDESRASAVALCDGDYPPAKSPTNPASPSYCQKSWLHRHHGLRWCSTTPLLLPYCCRRVAAGVMLPPPLTSEDASLIAIHDQYRAS